MTLLGEYAGRKVARATIEIRGTGSGLEKGLHLPPMVLDPGETYDVVLRCTVDKHRHDLDDEDGTFVLVNMLKAETATIVEPGEAADKALDDAEQRVAERKADAEAAKRAERGEDPLPFDGDRVGLGKPDLDAAEQAIRGRANYVDGEPAESWRTPLDDVTDFEEAAYDPLEGGP